MFFHPSGVKLAISFFRTKAKNAFYVSSKHFAVGLYKDMFFA